MLSSMTLLWTTAALSLAAALLAWRKARAAARRLEQLSQMYWELKYQHTELRNRVRRLDGDAAVTSSVADAPPADGFIPLSSLKR